MNISRYYVLELCNASLDKLFLTDDNPQKYKGPIPTSKDVLMQLAIGLEHIHNKGLVHRDLKPENVLIWVDQSMKKEVTQCRAELRVPWIIQHQRF